MHGDSLPMLSPLGLSNRKPLPLGMGYITMSEESNRSLVRDAITKTFYKFNKRQAIPIHEKENMGKLFDVYKLYGGNSYVCSLMEIANEWEVLSGEDAPSSRQKQ